MNGARLAGRAWAGAAPVPAPARAAVRSRRLHPGLARQAPRNQMPGAIGPRVIWRTSKYSLTRCYRARAAAAPARGKLHDIKDLGTGNHTEFTFATHYP